MIRTNDGTETVGENKNIVFENENRKGNLVKKFNIDLSNYSINFLVENLETKMIPKKEIKNFDEIIIKILSTTLGSLIFQDLNNSCNFLIYDEDEDKYIVSKFEDIQEYDSILCYDEITDDYCIAEVKEVFLYDSILDSEDNNPTREIKLSNYILYSENNGIILNNILILP